MSSTSLNSNYYQILGGNLKCTMNTPTIVSETATSITFSISGYSLYYASSSAKNGGKVRFQAPDGTWSGWISATKGSTVNKTLSTTNWQFTVNKGSAQTITKTFVIELTYTGNSTTNQSTKTWTTYVDAAYYGVKVYYGNGQSVDLTKWYGTDLSLSDYAGAYNTTYTKTYNYYPNKPGEGNGSVTQGSKTITVAHNFSYWSSSNGGMSGNSYTANGGSTITGVYNTWEGDFTQPVTTLNWSKTGFTYKGINTSSSATSVLSGTSNYADGTNFYGVWTHSFTFTGYGSNRNSSSSGEYYVANGAVSYPSTGSPSGFTFKTWRDSDGVNWGTEPPQSDTPSDTFTCIWNHSQTVYPNGGNGSAVTTTRESDQIVPITTPTRQYYKISSYNTAANGTGTTVTVANANLPTETASRTLYAQWEKGTYTVSFNSNGGTTSVASFDVISADGAEMIPAIGNYTPPDDSQRFLEWNTSPDGTGTSYSPGDDIRPEEDTVLYAIWTLKQIYIKLEDGQTMEGIYINAPE